MSWVGWRCQKCRHEFKQNQRFCPQCGYTVYDPIQAEERPDWIVQEEGAKVPRLAPGTYLLTKRVVVKDDGLSEFVDEPGGELIAGFFPRTRTRVTPVRPENDDATDKLDELVAATIRTAVDEWQAQNDPADGHGVSMPECIRRALADAGLLTPEAGRLAAEVERLRGRDEMHTNTRFQVEHILDAALGTQEEDGAGAGLAADVALVVQQRDEARAVAAADLTDRLAGALGVGLKYAPLPFDGLLSMVQTIRQERNQYHGWYVAIGRERDDKQIEIERLRRILARTEEKRDSLHAQLDKAIDLSRRLLKMFTTGEKGHPGRPCVRTGWIDESAVAKLHEELSALALDELSSQGGDYLGPAPFVPAIAPGKVPPPISEQLAEAGNEDAAVAARSEATQAQVQEDEALARHRAVLQGAPMSVLHDPNWTPEGRPSGSEQLSLQPVAPKPRDWQKGDRVHRPAWNWTGTVRETAHGANRYLVHWDHLLDRPLSNGASWCTSEELTEVSSPPLPTQEEGTDE